MLCCLQDDLRPLSCSGTNSQGGLALTLVDALDTLAVRSPSIPRCHRSSQPC